MVWTRLLVLILGPTTYAFSAVVSIFIVGLAGGAAVGARLAARARQPAIGLAMCLLAERRPGDRGGVGGRLGAAHHGGNRGPPVRRFR